jgi:hypothetical protein
MAGMFTPALAKLGYAVQRYRQAQGLSQENLRSARVSIAHILAGSSVVSEMYRL